MDDVFISYRRNKSEYAHLVYFALKAKGISVFLDTTKKERGYFPKYLENRINEAEFFVLIIGKDSLLKRTEKNWYKDEIDIALERNKNDKIDIIPVLIDGLKWPEGKDWPSDWLDYETYGKLSHLQSVTIDNDDNIGSKIDELLKLMTSLLPRMCLLELLKKSVSNCKTRNISDYILNSQEMKLESGCELRLLTNNLKNYDFLPIAKIAIARNISNGSKYIYYTPKECEDDFEVLKSSVNDYVKRNELANREIDKWIKKKYLYNRSIIELISSLNNMPKANFEKLECGCALLQEDALGEFFKYDSCFKYDSELDEIFSIDSLIEWLKGTLERNREIDEMLSKIGRISDIINRDSQLQNKWGKCLEYIGAVKIISDWILKKESEGSASNQACKICKRFSIHNSIIEWIDSKTDEEAEVILKRLEHRVLETSELPFEACYSFSLFLNRDKQTLAACWYTASDIQDMDIPLDNVAVVRDCHHEELIVVKRIFQRLDKAKDKPFQDIVDNTPAYVLRSSTLKDTLAQYTKYFNVYYPVKSNDEKRLLSLLNEYHCCYEVETKSNLQDLKSIGVRPEKILFYSPFSDKEDLSLAVQYGVRFFVISDKESLLFLESMGIRYNYLIRLKDDVTVHSKKIGISQNNFSDLLKGVSNGKFSGISFHISSDISTIEDKKEMIANVVEILRKCKRNGNIIDIGGGLNTENCDEIYQFVKDLGEYSIIVEPGRGLVDPCMDLVTTVVAIDENSGIAFLNVGIYNGLLDAVIKKRKYEIYALDNSNPASEKYLISGPTADELDVFGEYELPELKVGDKLIFKKCGAYSKVLSTDFYRLNKHILIIK